MRLRDPFRRLVRTRPALEAINWLSSSQPRVLLYHRFAEHTTPRRLGLDVFEAQMLELKSRFDLRTVSAVCDAIRDGRPMKDVAVVTIDDGYEDVHRYALPVLKRHGIPATFYVTTGFIDRQVWLWPDVIMHLVTNTILPEYYWCNAQQLRVLKLGTDGDRDEAWRVLATHAEGLPTAQVPEFLELLSASLDVEIPDAPTGPYRAMSWEQLRDFADAGIEIGDHTWSHPVLTRCQGARMREEIARSKARLEAALGAPVRSFAYPHGISSPEVRHAVREAGYASAVSVDGPPYEIGDLYDIKRLGPGDTLTQFKSMVYGVQILAHRLGAGA